MPANFEKSTITSARSAGASSSECRSTLPDVEAGRVGDPGGHLLAVHDHRGRQEAALGADLDPVRARQWLTARVRGREDDRVGLRGRQLGRVQRDLGRADDLAQAVQPVLAVVGSATYHWKLKKRSFAAFRMRKRYDFGSSVTVG